MFSKLDEYKDFLKEALTLLEDPDDSPYLALAFSTGAIIWSNDKGFKKQNKVKVYSTEEFLKELKL